MRALLAAFSILALGGADVGPVAAEDEAKLQEIHLSVSGMT